jgi:hypothetical protein
MAFYTFRQPGTTKHRRGVRVGAIIGVIVGSALAVFGFAAMRNPMRLNLLPFNPGAEGYYQRMVLDTSTRNQLRVLGALVCLFGSSIFTASLGATLKMHSLNAVSEGLWVLMGCIFLGAWGTGLIVFVWQLLKGQTFNWFHAWKLAEQVGPINVFPPITPKMRREAQISTGALLVLACIAALASLLRS